MKKVLVLFSLIAVSFFGHSQTTTSSINGNVTDSNKEPLPGASIAAVHTPTGSKYGSVSQFSGNYAIRNMKVGGPYKVTISYIGYQTATYEGVYLQLGQTFNLNAALNSDGEELETVVIDIKKNKTFNSGRTGSETSIGAKELRIMPTISRSAADFYRMDPTASGGSFGGRNDQFNNFTLDGSIFNNPFGLDAATPGGQTGSQPISIDAIEQIQVSTAPYDVSMSGFTGAAVNAVTKSGTNTFKGTVYGFYRNQDLTGSKVKKEAIFVPELKQLQYGVSIGGPIIKNKLFFFANFEKENRSDAGSNWIPNNGDATTGINEASVTLADMQAVSTALANLQFLNPDTGLLEDVGYDTGAIQGFSHESGSYKGIVKLDYNMNDKHKLAFVYNFMKATKEKPAHPTAIGFRGPNATTLQFENSGYKMNNNIQSFLTELNSNFTDKISNKFQIGYTHFDDYRDPKSTPAPVINIQNGSGSNYIIAGHEPFSINNVLDQKVFQISDKVNVLLDKHNLTFGLNFEKFSFKNSFNLAAYDTFSFPYRGTFFIPGFGGPYPSVADFLADAANTSGVTATNFYNAQVRYDGLTAAGTGVDDGWKLAELNVGQFAVYAQDEWSVNNEFKLTFGIRADKPMYFDTSDLIQKYIDTNNGASRDNTIDYFDPATGNAVKLNSTVLPTDKMIISPRLGFNWNAKGDKTLQLRGGTGIFTGRLPFVWLGNQVSGADDVFFQIVDKDFEWPRVWKSSLGLDTKFKNGLVASADFSYTKDIIAAHVQNWGLKAPSANLIGADDRAVYAGADYGSNNAYVFTNSNKGYAFTTTFKIEKSFKNKLYANLAYNYMEAKSVNSIEAEITGDAFAFNPVVGNVNDDVLTHSKYGDKHRIIGVVSKQWQYGKNNKWGTTFSAFFEYAQGGRFSYTYGGDINNDGSIVNDLLYIPTATELTAMSFSGAGQAAAFESFIQQDDYLSENRGKYAERYGALSPWRSKFDIKLMQDYEINGSQKIQLSIDILNAGNMLNSNWGVVEQPKSVQPIGVNVVAGVPTYTFDGTITETFVYDTSLLSRWQMQFGLRFIF